MKRALKLALDILCFVIGPVLFVVNVASIDIDELLGSYYYPHDAKLGMGLGIGLLAFGFVRIYWKKSKLESAE